MFDRSRNVMYLVLLAVVIAGLSVVRPAIADMMPGKSLDAKLSMEEPVMSRPDPQSLDEGCLPADSVWIKLHFLHTDVVVAWHCPQPGIYRVHRTLVTNPGPVPGPNWLEFFSLDVDTIGWISVADPLGANTYANYTVIHECPVPPNNDCGNALTVTAGEHYVSTIGATTDTPVPAVCTSISNDIWFRYLALCTGSLTIDMCGSNYDAMIAVYPGSFCPDENLALMCSDDDCGFPSPRMTFSVTQGAWYYLRVGGFSGATGTGILRIIPGPLNNRCQFAQTIQDGTTLVLDNACATTDGPLDPYPCEPRDDLWYRFTASVCGRASVNLCNTNWDTQVTVYHTNDCGNLGTPVACNDDSAFCSPHSTGSIAYFEVEPDETYLIRVGSFATGSDGSGFITMDEFSSLANNNICANAVVLPEGTTVINTHCCTTEAPQTACGQIYEDVWFIIPLQANRTYTINTCGTGFDTRLAVYNLFNYSCGGLPAPFVCNDNYDPCVLNARVQFSTGALPFGPYYLRAGSAAQNMWGPLQINMSVVAN